MVLELIAFAQRAHCMEQCAHNHHGSGHHKTHKTGLKLFHIRPKPRALLNRNMCSQSEIDTTEFVQPALPHHPCSSETSVFSRQPQCGSSGDAASDSTSLKSGANVVGYFHPIPQFNGHIIQGTASTPDRSISQRDMHLSNLQSPSASGCGNGGRADPVHSSSHSPQQKPSRGLTRPYSMQSLASLLSHKSPASLFRHNSRGRARNVETLTAAELHMQGMPCNSMSQESICSSNTSMDSSSCHRD
jgi:hypothetical protein